MRKKYRYKSIRMFSKYDVAYAKTLSKQGKEWQYRPKHFDLQNGISFIPDFYIPDDDLFIELKKNWTKEHIKHYKLFKKLYESVNIKLVSIKKA